MAFTLACVKLERLSEMRREQEEGLTLGQEQYFDKLADYIEECFLENPDLMEVADKFNFTY